MFRHIYAIRPTFFFVTFVTDLHTWALNYMKECFTIQYYN